MKSSAYAKFAKGQTFEKFMKGADFQKFMKELNFKRICKEYLLNSSKGENFLFSPFFLVKNLINS